MVQKILSTLSISILLIVASCAQPAAESKITQPSIKKRPVAISQVETLQRSNLSAMHRATYPELPIGHYSNGAGIGLEIREDGTVYEYLLSSPQNKELLFKVIAIPAQVEMKTTIHYKRSIEGFPTTYIGNYSTALTPPHANIKFHLVYDDVTNIETIISMGLLPDGSTLYTGDSGLNIFQQQQELDKFQSPLNPAATILDKSVVQLSYIFNNSPNLTMEQDRVWHDKLTQTYHDWLSGLVSHTTWTKID